MPRSPQETARRERLLAEYQRRAIAPLLVNGFLFVCALIVQLTDRDPVTEWILRLTWVVFVTDYFVMLYLSPRRWLFLTTHVYYLAALVFPPVRVVILVEVAARATMSRHSPLRDRIGLITAYVTALIVTFGALFTWMAERGQPGADIETYGDSLWWAVVSVTTVGYGDFVPVTVIGRITATIVFLAGIAALSVLTAFVVSFVGVETRRRGRRGLPDAGADGSGASDPAADDTSIDLREINQRLAAIETALLRLGVDPPASPDPLPRMGSGSQEAPQEAPPPGQGPSGGGQNAPPGE